VDQKGVHLLENRSRNVLTSFDYEALLDYTPSLSHLLLITGSDRKQSKIVVNTSQAFQIANLIREYISVVHASLQQQQQQQYHLQQQQQQPVSILKQPQQQQPQHFNENQLTSFG